MKKKFSKVLGVGLTLALLTSLLVSMVPASAATNNLYPHLLIPREGLALAPDNHVIVDIAANGSTVFAATANSTASTLWKSTSTGSTTSWSDITATTAYPTGGNSTMKLVAVAPDDADVVVIVNTNNIPYYSDDGGSSWSDLGIPAASATVNALEISPLTDGYYYIVAAGAVSSAAELWTLKLAMAEAWVPRVAGAAGVPPGMLQMNAVQFSPNFDIDKVITCVAGNTTDAYFQMFRAESGAYTWNGQITFASDWGIGVKVTDTLANGGVNAVTSGVASASIALPDSYLGNDEGERIAFVGIAGGGTDEGGVTRLADNYLAAIGTWSAQVLGAINSLAYNGDTLVAGSFDNNQVYRCLDPLAVLPRCERLNNLKQPGGSNPVTVAWAGDKLVASVQGDEGGFSVSTDNGYAFNDISLINTNVLGPAASWNSDITVSPDGSKYYLTTLDLDDLWVDPGPGLMPWAPFDVSVWLGELGGYQWTRILSIKNATWAGSLLPGVGITPLLVRLAPEDDSVIYLAAGGTQRMWVSKDSGLGRWKEIPCYKVSSTTGIADFVVESADVAYAIDTSSCTKTSNAGASWGTSQPLNCAGSSITLAPNNDVLVGGSDGYITWSKDGGATFTRSRLPVGLLLTANVEVMADPDYEANGIVWATCGSATTGEYAIYKGETTMGMFEYTRGPDPEAQLDYVYYGLAVSDGIFYALSSNGTDSLLWRAPAAAVAAAASTAEARVLWSAYSSTATLNSSPKALVPVEGPGVWTLARGIASMPYNLNDPIAIESPTAIAPEDAFTVPVNPANGNAYDVTFTWERYSSSYVTAFQLLIATDSNFDAIIYNSTFTGITTDTISVVIGASGGTAYGGSLSASLMPGTTYYWTVRVAAGGPAYSPWSETRSLTVDVLEAAGAVTVEIPDIAPAAVTAVAPAMGAMDVPLQPTLVWPAAEGVTGYEVMVSEYADFSILEWSHTTDQNFYPADESFAYDTTYYWRARASEPEEGAWTTGVFTTMAKPAEPVVEEPTIITVPGETEVVTVEVEKAAAIPNYLLWTIIAIGAVLVIALIVLIVRTRRVA